MNTKQTECTTILVGKEQMIDNSMIIARSADSNAMIARHLKIYRDTENGPDKFEAEDTPFKCQLPKKFRGYTAIERCVLHGHWGSAGFNTAKVGMSATESIFCKKEALDVDPHLETGVGENSVFNIVLPYITSAREGVERLGALIEEYGTCEGFGVAFVDQKEVWYLETASGHRYLATRLPDDMYFITGNQGRLRQYDPEDKDNYFASKDLIEFALKHNLYQLEEGEFDFHNAYIRDVESDKTYSYPRVWAIQKMLSPAIKNQVDLNTFPVFAKAENKMSISDVRKVFRHHYQGTEHDPYENKNPQEQYRPISIFRATQTHILQVRPSLPLEIGEVNYINIGMATLGLFIPFYQGVQEYLKEYMQGGSESSQDSAYWKFRKVQTLAMVNFSKYAPIVQKAYFEWEVDRDQKMSNFETNYLKIQDKEEAQQNIQRFAEETMQSAMDLADHLVEVLFTELTRDIQSEYRFAGA